MLVRPGTGLGYRTEPARIAWRLRLSAVLAGTIGLRGLALGPFGQQESSGMRASPDSKVELKVRGQAELREAIRQF